MAFTRFTKNVLNVSALPDRVQNQAQTLKATFDQAGVDIKTALNALIVELEASTSADNIGADVQSVATKTVQAVLTAFEESIANRYTKLEAETLLLEGTNNLVADIDVNLTNGVITITKKDGTQTIIDTAIEKVPSKFEIVESGNTYYLRITNLDGTTTQADVTSLMNIYHFNNSDTISFEMTGEGNQKNVTANVRANSIGLDKLELNVVSTLEGYMTNAKDSATAAKTSETNARTSELNALEAKNSALNSAASATTSAQTATSASKTAQEMAQTVTTTSQQAKQEITTVANNAKTTVTSAANSAKTEITNAVNSAKTELNATATQAKTETNSNAILAKSYAVGGTGSRNGEDVDNAKYYSEQAKATVSGDYVTRPEFQESIKNFATEEYVDNALANFDGGITEIPVATADTLGGIKVGEGLEITADGILSVEGGASSGVGYVEVDLLTSPATAKGTFALSDSVFNYDEIQVEVFIMSATTPVKAMHKEVARILPSQIKDNEENEFTLSHYTANNSNYSVAFGFTADGSSLFVDAVTKGSNWSSRTAGVSRVIGINYDIKVLEGAINVDNTPTAGSENVVTSGGIKTYVDTQVATKTDKTYVDAQVATKVDATYVNNAVSSKVDATYVTNAISGKADTSYVNTALAGKAVVKKFTATIPTSGWTSSFPYTVTITVDGMLASDSNFPVSPVYSDTLSTRMAQAEEWGKVTMIAAGNNSIVVTCDEEKPTTAIPIQITVVR